MKKLILAAFALTTAASVFAQGTIVFQNRQGTVLTTHIYAPNSSIGLSYNQVGQGSNDFISGATSWAGWTAIGSQGGQAGMTGQYGASTTFSELLGASGYNQLESSLLPAAGVTTFKTGAAAGGVVTITSTLNNTAPGQGQATLEMVAWDNSSGLYSTWTLASVAWLNDLIAAGKSGTWNQDSLGGLGPAPFMVNGEVPGQQAVSFNLYFVPEPSTFALAGLGAAALLIFRRRK